MERAVLEQGRAGSEAEEARAGEKSPAAGLERRARTRIPWQLPLNVKHGGIYEAAAQAANFSASGMFFTLAQRLKVGTQVDLVFCIPPKVLGVNGVWLRCPAEVVRVEEGLPDNRFGMAAKIKSYEVFRIS
jgi:hypothetical protein